MTRIETIGAATLILADCLSWLADPFESARVIGRGGAIVSDVPYGMAHDTDNGRFTGGEGEGQRGRKMWPRIVGDDKPFDPAPWIKWPEAILWGANHYAQRLPVGSTLVWVKKREANFGKFLSDAEIGWQKGGHGVYCAAIEWSAQGRRSEGIDNLSVHPAQKPVDLMRWCINRVKSPTIIDPYMGSGTTGVAALQEGRRFVGFEIVPEYFATACRRVSETNARLSAGAAA